MHVARDVSLSFLQYISHVGVAFESNYPFCCQERSQKAPNHFAASPFGDTPISNVDSPFFSTIVLSKFRPFSLGSEGFLARRIPGKNWGGIPRTMPHYLAMFCHNFRAAGHGELVMKPRRAARPLALG